MKNSCIFAIMVVYVLLMFTIYSKDYDRRMDLKQLRSMIEYYHGEQSGSEFLTEVQSKLTKIQNDNEAFQNKLDTIIHTQTIEKVIREKE